MRLRKICYCFSCPTIVGSTFLAEIIFSPSIFLTERPRCSRTKSMYCAQPMVMCKRITRSIRSRSAFYRSICIASGGYRPEMRTIRCVGGISNRSFRNHCRHQLIREKAAARANAAYGNVVFGNTLFAMMKISTGILTISIGTR